MSRNLDWQRSSGQVCQPEKAGTEFTQDNLLFFFQKTNFPLYQNVFFARAVRTPSVSTRSCVNSIIQVVFLLSTKQFIVFIQLLPSYNTKFNPDHFEHTYPEGECVIKNSNIHNYTNKSHQERLYSQSQYINDMQY